MPIHLPGPLPRSRSRSPPTDPLARPDSGQVSAVGQAGERRHCLVSGGSVENGQVWRELLPSLDPHFPFVKPHFPFTRPHFPFVSVTYHPFPCHITVIPGRITRVMQGKWSQWMGSRRQRMVSAPLPKNRVRKSSATLIAFWLRRR